ncbi:MAG: ATP-dependent DNA helicase RecG [Erysipelotrichaceae bacterium]|nr:ATP-dependent DNA helicase RecG [Erysipelotrichaceae bacterium]
MELKALKLTPKRLQICQKLNLNSGEEILRYYPFRYENFQVTPFESWKAGDNVVFSGEVATFPTKYRARRSLTITSFLMFYGEEELKVTIYNRPWMNLQVGQQLSVVGKYDGNHKVTATNCAGKPIEEFAGIHPVYPLKEGITQNDIRKLIQAVFAKEKCEDHFPPRLLSAHGLIAYREALNGIHFPQNTMQLRQALARLKYEEFLNFYLALKLREKDLSGIRAAKDFSSAEVEKFIQQLPFELTADQRTACDEILGDMHKNVTMSRLVQGDVGSGKTVVAVVALYANHLSGYQGALMAPTEILAKQHYESLKELFAGKEITIVCLTSSEENQKEIKRALKNGEIDILVGTHSLFSEDVEYEKLGLVIADEQHRFGVEQRRKLKEKGKDCDLLLMSATPIPRTLAASLYGDLHVSTIESMPPGRKGCVTTLIRKNSLKTIEGELKKILEEGRQVYIIASMIEKSENFKAKDAESLYQALVKVFAPFRTGLLHGRMSAEEKEAVMNAFARNEIQVLVSTTVVEVGVNVKNATAMVVYDADRFGLSQLHQLRGRIQRSSYQGHFYLLTDSKEESTLKRLKVLVDTNDGFKVAVEDLKERGPGDLLGTRQAGLPSFVLGNLITDTKMIEAARKDAEELLSSNDPGEKAYVKKIADLSQQLAVE